MRIPPRQARPLDAVNESTNWHKGHVRKWSGLSRRPERRAGIEKWSYPGRARLHFRTTVPHPPGPAARNVCSPRHTHSHAHIQTCACCMHSRTTVCMQCPHICTTVRMCKHTQLLSYEEMPLLASFTRGNRSQEGSDCYRFMLQPRRSVCTR